MALVRMKKLFVVGPVGRRDEIIDRLEQLGAVHVTLDSDVEMPPELSAEHSRLQRVIKHLSGLERRGGCPFDDADSVLQKYDDLVSARSRLEQELASTDKDIGQLAPWGDVPVEDLGELAARKQKDRFYQLSKKERQTFDTSVLDGAVWYGWTSLKGSKPVGLAVIWKGDSVDLGLEEYHIPNRSMAVIERARQEIISKINGLDDEFQKLAPCVGLLRDRLADIERRMERAMVYASALEDGPVVAISGYVPASDAQKVVDAFENTPVLTLVQEPEPDKDMDVPIEFRNTWLVRYFEPLIRMFSLPSYWEVDPTPLVAPFMAVFFGFCLGDGAYGLLLFGVGTWLASKFKSNPAVLTGMRLLQVLGASSAIIGLGMGQVFGYQVVSAPWAQSIRQYLFLGRFASDPLFFFYVSLIFGVIQLSVGLFTKVVISLVRGRVREALATLGWAGLFAAGVQYYYTHQWWGFLVAAAMIFVFSTPFEIKGSGAGAFVMALLRWFGGGLYSLYNVSGLFGDVMSYARIFGLGMSSAVLAAVINQLATTVYGDGSVTGIVFGGIILVFGHTFNFIMAIIGSMVHSGRLQFLEFYKQFFEGGGKPYSPFGRKLKEKKETN